MNGDPIDRLRILVDDVTSTWPNAPAIFRDLPVAFGGIQALSYTECMVGFAWDLALTLSTLIEIRETGIFLVEWERLKSIFDSYPAPSGIAPPAKQQKFHAVALAAIAEIMRERQRLMSLPKTVKGGFENSTRRHSSLFGPITNRHHEWAYARDCAIVDGSSDLTYVQGAALSEAQIEILLALKEGNAAGRKMTQDVLAQAARGSKRKDGEFGRQYRLLVMFGYIESGKRGPRSPGSTITDSGLKALAMHTENQAKKIGLIRHELA